MAEDDRMDIDGMLPTTPGRSYFVFINGYIYISEIEENKGTRKEKKRKERNKTKSTNNIMQRLKSQRRYRRLQNLNLK